ncbi:MAG: hypothetical protein JXR68_14355 [Bacteroidales bacterium]|nr:hypothetical protein [Bacteroidales bacterium]
MTELLETVRLPITENNIEIIIQEDNVSSKTLINEKSGDAALTIIGFREEMIKHEREKYFEGYDNVGIPKCFKKSDFIFLKSVLKSIGITTCKK